MAGISPVLKGFYAHHEGKKRLKKKWPAFPLFSRGFLLDWLVFSGARVASSSYPPNPASPSGTRSCCVYFVRGGTREGVATSHHFRFFGGFPSLLARVLHKCTRRPKSYWRLFRTRLLNLTG
jgi:hypothetical protein